MISIMDDFSYMTFYVELVELERRFRSLEEYTQVFMKGSLHTQPCISMTPPPPIPSPSAHITSTMQPSGPNQIPPYMNEHGKLFSFMSLIL